MANGKNKQARRQEDFYPTPEPPVIAALDCLPSGFMPHTILDPGAGTGVWGDVARRRWPDAAITGTELRSELPTSAYNAWRDGNFLTMPWYQTFDLVIGNPPYKLAEEFVRRSVELTNHNGYIVLLLRLGFLEGQARGESLWRELRPAKVAVSSMRPSFTGDGKTDGSAYATFVWQIGYHGPTMLDWMVYPDNVIELPAQQVMAFL